MAGFAKTIAAGAAVGVALASVGAATTSNGKAETGPGTIQVSDQQRDYRRIDSGATGHGPGDVELIRAALFNRKIRSRAIGHSELVCTIVAARTRSCNGTYFLPKGKIVVSGVIGLRLLYEFAVVGGTGLYDNARGTLTATVTSRLPRREILIFRLVG